jgi:hypothetical protein
LRGWGGRRIDMTKCCVCGKFCSWNSDRGIPYGCSDPNNPEPYDLEYFCDSCAKKEYEKSLEQGENMYVYWEKPLWQIKAMKELGLVERDYRLVKILN